MPEQRERSLGHARRALFEAHRRERTSEWIQASGRSMSPLIAPGTWMQVEFGAAPERLGEIVVFPAGDVLVAHRFVGSLCRGGRALLVAKGDAVPYCDPAVAPEDVLGVVRALRDRNGDVTTVGCTGAGARVLGGLSGSCGRGAWRARRAAAALPAPAARLVLALAPALSLGATRLSAAPLAWAAGTPRIAC